MSNRLLSLRGGRGERRWTRPCTDERLDRNVQDKLVRKYCPVSESVDIIPQRLGRAVICFSWICNSCSFPRDVYPSMSHGDIALMLSFYLSPLLSWKCETRAVPFASVICVGILLALIDQWSLSRATLHINCLIGPLHPVKGHRDKVERFKTWQSSLATASFRLRSK